ncbi:sugar-binding transcriptional regulator [Agromyces sp. LHK192]|uniref:sugar-binding transcriptional regulator n=1 Tax=Agromyces sp. LHK192 TaxID=2498704 RepID=UPI000FDBD164|nr:sugar-binding domain-containing protein [Agromyces sp. LHK192]
MAVGTGPARGSGHDRRLLILKVARLYHEGGLRQAEIASRLGLSQSQVSRMLTAATEQGFVRTIVVQPRGVHTDLEEAVRAKFGLADVIVADASGDQRAVSAAIARAGAAYLETTIGARERIGISSWSSTLLAVVGEITRPSPRPAATVVQILGGMGVPSVQVYATQLTDRLARLVGARPVFLTAPGLTASPRVRRALLHDDQVAAAAREWDRLDTVLLGVGSLTPSALIRASGNAVPADDRAALLGAGAVGDISLRYFDEDGAEVVTGLSERVLGIGGDVLRAVPRRVGIAGGDEKRLAIAASLRGGWISVLVTDAGVARWLASTEVSPRGGPEPYARR